MGFGGWLPSKKSYAGPKNGRSDIFVPLGQIGPSPGNFWLIKKGSEAMMLPAPVRPTVDGSNEGIPALRAPFGPLSVQRAPLGSNLTLGTREPGKPKKALKTLHPSQERVPRGAHMAPPYFEYSEDSQSDPPFPQPCITLLIGVGMALGDPVSPFVHCRTNH